MTYERRRTKAVAHGTWVPAVVVGTSLWVVALAHGAPPVNTSPPTISGSPSYGQTLTASPGNWQSDSPVQLTLQWMWCPPSAPYGLCIGAPGEVPAWPTPPRESDEFVVGCKVLGSAVKLGVTASNADGSTEAFSDKLAIPQQACPSPPAVIGAPTVSGDAVEGEMLAISPGTWTGTQPFVVGRRWRVCSTASFHDCSMFAADSYALRLDATHVGKTLTYQEAAWWPDDTKHGAKFPVGVVLSRTPSVVAKLVKSKQARTAQVEVFTDRPGDVSITVSAKRPGRSAVLGSKRQSVEDTSSLVDVELGQDKRVRGWLRRSRRIRLTGQATFEPRTGTTVTAGLGEVTATGACRVPKLNGKRPRKAKALLRKAGCRQGKVRKPRVSKRKARRLKRRGYRLVVIRQAPKPATEAAEGTKVKLRLGWRKTKKRAGLRGGRAPLLN